MIIFPECPRIYVNQPFSKATTTVSNVQCQRKIMLLIIKTKHGLTSRLVQWQEHGSRASGGGEFWSEQV